MVRAFCWTIAGTCGLVAIGIIVALLIVFAVQLSGCEAEVATPIGAVAPGAPAKDVPVGWVAHNVRLHPRMPAVTTATEIVFWIQYEIDGTQTVSRKVRIPKGGP